MPFSLQFDGMEATNGQDGFKLSKRRVDYDGVDSYDMGTEQILLSAQSKDAEVPPSPRLPDISLLSNIETVPEAVLSSSSNTASPMVFKTV